MYKIDHKKLRAKIKNLEQGLDFQRYNIREKQKEKGRKKEKKKRKKEKELLKNKQTNKQTIKKKPSTTIQRLYMVFALKKKSLFKKQTKKYSNNRLQK